MLSAFGGGIFSPTRKNREGGEQRIRFSGGERESGLCRDAKLEAITCAGIAVAPFAIRFVEFNMKARKCRTCFGAGHSSCACCHGRGKVGGIFRDVEPASQCAACGGTGRQPCLACGESGLANSWLWSPKKGPGIWGARGEW